MQNEKGNYVCSRDTMALLVRESQRRRTKGFFKLQSLQLEENQKRNNFQFWNERKTNLRILVMIRINLIRVFENNALMNSFPELLRFFTFPASDENCNSIFFFIILNNLGYGNNTQTNKKEWVAMIAQLASCDNFIYVCHHFISQL